MIAEYLFYLMFTMQIWMLSMVHPEWLSGKTASLMQRYPREQFPQLYPIGAAAIERIVLWYRALNWVIVAVGLVFLLVIYRYMQQPDWDDGPVGALVFLYLLIQIIPMLLRAVAISRFNRSLWQNFATARQTAVLRRRRLTDFISPVSLGLAGMLYVAFVLLVIYIEENPYPGFGGYINILSMTLLYVFFFSHAWTRVYGKKENPYLSQDARLHNIGIHVKLAVYSCMAIVTYRILIFVLALSDAQSYEPAMQSAFLVCISTLLVAGLCNAGTSLNLDAARPAN